MGGSYKVPSQIANGKYPWLFVKEWKLMQNTMAGNNLHVTAGMPGSGKTYQQLYKAERLSFDRHGEQRLFQPKYLWEHLAWGASDLAVLITELSKKNAGNTRGYQIIVDEGQLALFSKDAMKEEVKNLSKLLMTVRSKRWGIQINLPSIGMLSKDVRSIVNSVVIMRGVPTNYSFGSYYHLELNPFDGEIYWRKPVFYKIHKTVSGMPMIERKSGGVLTWDKPSKVCRRVYERLKRDHQAQLFSEYGDKAIDLSKMPQQSYDEKILGWATIIVEQPKPFLDGRKIVAARVKRYFAFDSLRKKELFDVMRVAQSMLDEARSRKKNKSSYSYPTLSYLSGIDNKVSNYTNNSGSGMPDSMAAGTNNLNQPEIGDTTHLKEGSGVSIHTRRDVWVPDWVKYAKKKQ